MTGIKPTFLYSSSATAARASGNQQQTYQQAFFVDSDGNQIPVPDTLGTIGKTYYTTAKTVQDGLVKAGEYIGRTKPSENTTGVERFARNTAAKGLEAILPAPEPIDLHINKHFGRESGEDINNLQYLITTLHRIINAQGFSWFFKPNKLQLAWEKLADPKLETFESIASLMKIEPEAASKVEKLYKGEISQEAVEKDPAAAQLLGAVQARNYFLRHFHENEEKFANLGMTKEDFFNTVNNRFSLVRQLGAFVFFPALGSGAFQIGRFFLQAGAQPLAQLAFLLGTGLASTQSFLIGQTVSKQMTFDHLSPRLKALIPFVQLGTILSHSVAPILNMLGIAFNFEGVISGGKKDNAFGKVNGFFSNALEMLRPMSMLGFALNHWNGLQGLKAEYKGKETSHAFKLGSKFENFGFIVNMIGFGLWSVSQVVSMFIENHDKQVNAKYEPIIEEIQQKLMMAQEALKQQVIAGKTTKEAAIQKLTQMEAEAKQFVQTELLPAYNLEMEGWKRASWLVGVINWLAFLGVTIQMYSSKPRGIALAASRIQDAEPGTKFWGGVNRIMNKETGGTLQRTMLYGGMTAQLVGLVGSSLLDGVSTVFGQNSPFAKFDQGGLASKAEAARRNPVIGMLLNLSMFG
ncbi:MAG: MucBP domain-containing protein [Candidatus Caenarcaniphilales bacterium]|nr:MucBP domain-containing protein [Candidatus Caenarcaniphilales bacterium]